MARTAWLAWGAIERLGWPLDRIVHAEVWATDTIPADLPPMVEFKAKADRIIKERWGIEVEHIRAKRCYEDVFYTVCHGEKSKISGKIYGWPFQRGPWRNSRLKQSVLGRIQKGAIHYIWFPIQHIIGVHFEDGLEIGTGDAKVDIGIGVMEATGKPPITIKKRMKADRQDKAR